MRKANPSDLQINITGHTLSCPNSYRKVNYFTVCATSLLEQDSGGINIFLIKSQFPPAEVI